MRYVMTEEKLGDISAEMGACLKNTLVLMCPFMALHVVIELLWTAVYVKAGK
jgi:hypothetical protein